MLLEEMGFNLDLKALLKLQKAIRRNSLFSVQQEKRHIWESTECVQYHLSHFSQLRKSDG